MACYLIKTSYNVDKMKTDIETLKDEYLEKNPRLKNWQGIGLRNIGGVTGSRSLSLLQNKTNPNLNSRHLAKGKSEFKYTKYLDNLPYIKEVLNDIESLFGEKLGLIRILKLTNHTEIPEHSDGMEFSLNRGNVLRLHVPIATDENVLFYINKQPYGLKAGNLYYTDVSFKHKVVNNSDIDRIHMVIDVPLTDKTRAIVKKSLKIDSIKK